MIERANPLGVEAFQFVEFAAPDPELLHALFKRLGFSAVARHRSGHATLYRQGQIDFIVNELPDSFAADFVAAHGPCCVGFALRVADPAEARALLLADGVAPVRNKPDTVPVQTPMVSGIGGSILYLCAGRADLERSFVPIPGADPHPVGAGLKFVDHLTHNVQQGNMDEWADFYARHFGFFEVKYFDIRGRQTGLRSRAMTAPNHRISIPINESSDPRSQINEYLEQYRGEGVQHIALYTDDIYPTVEAMSAAGVGFLPTPATYYDVVDRRIPNHGEDLERMRANGILIDADPNDPERQLLQIFTETAVGPIFFEVIQRKGNEGFGEGNFAALFEAIERDQQRRGVL